MIDVGAAVLTPAMRNALWEHQGNRNDAWHFFSGIKHCPICQKGIHTPYEFPTDKIPRHNNCEKVEVKTEQDRIRLDSAPSLDPVGMEDIGKILDDIRKGILSPENARPLCKTLLEEMVPK